MGAISRQHNYYPDRFAVHLPSSTKNVIIGGGGKGRAFATMVDPNNSLSPKRGNQYAVIEASQNTRMPLVS